MLPRNKKVKRSLFLLFKNSKSFQSQNISLRVYSSGDTKKGTRFSFIVSKKVSSMANKRNLLKRRGYYVVENIKNIRNGFICIFYFKKGVTTLSYKELKEEIVKLLKDSGVSI